jgi:hypothetical protein
MSRDQNGAGRDGVYGGQMHYRSVRMDDFFSTIWFYLVRTYYEVYRAGYPGCAFAFAGGWYLSNRGTRLTGREQRYTGDLHNGSVNLRHVPAIQAEATTWLGHMFGVLLKLVGLVLVVIALLATVNTVLYGTPRY